MIIIIISTAVKLMNIHSEWISITIRLGLSLRARTNVDVKCQIFENVIDRCSIFIDQAKLHQSSVNNCWYLRGIGSNWVHYSQSHSGMRIFVLFLFFRNENRISFSQLWVYMFIPLAKRLSMTCHSHSRLRRTIKMQSFWCSKTNFVPLCLKCPTQKRVNSIEISRFFPSF